MANIVIFGIHKIIKVNKKKNKKKDSYLCYLIVISSRNGIFVPLTNA